jgi:competence protein ComEA
MNTTINNEGAWAPRVLKRIVTLTALVVFVATGTATWMTSGTAEAAPRHQAPAVSCERVAEADTSRKNKKAKTTKKAKAKKKKAKKKTKKLTGKLNLNTASEQQLRMLPGIGATKAKRVVEYREKKGKFKRVIDLRRVKGFGRKSVKKLDKYLTVSTATSLKYE